MRRSLGGITYWAIPFFLLMPKHNNPMDAQREKRLCSIAAYQLKKGTGQLAIKTLTRPVEAKYAPAQNLLGMCYQYGHDVEHNPSLAVQLYEDAAKKGLVSALFNLGYCYETGFGVEKNIKKAKVLYQATLGYSSYAYYRLGRLYIAGLDIEKNEKLGFSILEQAAEKGCEKALFTVGRCYELGSGVTQNFNQAADIYRKYVEKTDKKALCSICTEPILDNNSDQLLLACPRRHIFHEHCLLKWIHTCLTKPTKPTCPTCREPLTS